MNDNFKHDGTDPLTAEEREAARDPHRFIAAIKLYRDRTSCSLKAAKEAVERVKFGFKHDGKSICQHCNGTGYANV